MCCCGKPTLNGEPGYSWDGKTFGTYPVNPPALADGDVLLFDEPGRCGGLDSHSHHFRLVKRYSYGDILLVRHGGGQEAIRLCLPRGFSFDGIDSHTRYWLFHAIQFAHSEARREGAADTAAEYRRAFIEGRLKKRKQPGRDAFKVWIEPKSANIQSATEAN